jgi:hypothetical protein
MVSAGSHTLSVSAEETFITDIASFSIAAAHTSNWAFVADIRLIRSIPSFSAFSRALSFFQEVFSSAF